VAVITDKIAALYNLWLAKGTGVTGKVVVQFVYGKSREQFIPPGE